MTKKSIYARQTRILLNSSILLLFAGLTTNSSTILADSYGGESNASASNRQTGSISSLEEINADAVELKHKEISETSSIETENSYLETPSNVPLIDQAHAIHKQGETSEEHKKLDGRGVLIASIDSGVDLTHETLNLDHDISDHHLKEKTVASGATRKVPYVFDTISGDTSIKDDQTEHGMHIAGVLVGNTKNGFKGMAKNAQLLAYRTWSKDNSEGYQGSSQFFAMEDAMNRKADIISLSIGEVGTGRNDDIWAKVLERAKKEDIIIAAAMGNYGTSSMTNSYDTLVDEKFSLQDSSTLLSVSSNDSVLGVGAYYDTHMHLPHLKVGDLDLAYENVNWHNYFLFKQKEQAQISFDTDIIDLDQKKEGTTIGGKIVLVNRKNEQIYQQLATIMEEKPKGIILVNAATTTTYGNYKTLPEIRSTLLGDSKGLFQATWAISISANDGEKLRDYLKKQSQKSSRFIIERDPKLTKVFEHKGISGFSTWGPRPDLELKPDLVAPGENVYSSGNENSYYNDSGTSMAAPHVAGASAMLLPIIKQFQAEWNKNFTKISLIQLNKLLLQNTADVLIDHTVPNGKPLLPYSPRRQGAGAVNLLKALKTKVFLSDENLKGAISLKDFTDKEKTFSLVLHNLSDKEQFFKLEASPILGKVTYENKRQNLEKTLAIKTIHSRQIEEASLLAPRYVRIAPNSQMTIPMTLKVGKAKMDEFIEGFIHFKSLNKEQADLSIPFLGFHGDWNREKIVDPVAWQDGSKTKMTGIVKAYPIGLEIFDYVPWGVDYQKWKEDHNNLEADPRHYVMQSLGGIDSHALMKLRLIFMRHAKDFQVEITDSADPKLAKTLKVLKVGHYYPKFMESAYQEYPDRYQPMFGDYDPDLEWDGSLYNAKTNDDQPINEGSYFIRIKARLDETRPWQETYIPFTVDNTKPKVSLVRNTDKEVLLAITDKHLKNVTIVTEDKVIKELKVDSDGYYHVPKNSGDAYSGHSLIVEDFGENRVEYDLQELLKGNLKEKESKRLTKKSLLAETSVLKPKKKLIPQPGHDIEPDSDTEWEDDSQEWETNDSNPKEFTHGTDFHDGKLTSAYTEATASNDVDIDFDENGNAFRTYYIHLQKGQHLFLTNTNALYNAKQKKSLFAPSWQERYDYQESDYKDSHFKEIKVPIFQGSNTLNVKAYYNNELISNKGYAIKLDTHTPELTFHNTNIHYFHKEGLDAEDREDQLLGEITIPNNVLRLAGKIKDAQDGWKLFVNGDMVDSRIKDGEYDDYFHQNESEWAYEKVVEDGDYVKVVISDYVNNNTSYLFKVKIDPKTLNDGLDEHLLKIKEKKEGLLLENQKTPIKKEDLVKPVQLTNFSGRGITNAEDLIYALAAKLPDYSIQVLSLSIDPRIPTKGQALIQLQKGQAIGQFTLNWENSAQSQQKASNTLPVNVQFSFERNNQNVQTYSRGLVNSYKPGKASQNIGSLVGTSQSAVAEKTLPETGEKQSNLWYVFAVFFSLFYFKSKNKKINKSNK
ncbi:S8 family serine peptidase [Streptococcus pseudoporcinus]|uniref:S8 family serine peptidase n=1 Tax=Streptococcus pseudoporcinus TaxID=361101 RepID=UPI000F6E3D15|nr:S8 family serine peptidase [Streptococcus pseudoporcinus]VEF92893.1 surface-anchored subtilase family protein [Streptococcus pseudoporcinus]